MQFTRCPAGLGVSSIPRFSRLPGIATKNRGRIPMTEPKNVHVDEGLRPARGTEGGH
jgi:hypothetical protein